MRDHLRSLLISLALVVLTGFAAFAQSSWVPFSPAGRGFSVMLPTANVETKTEERQGETFTIYSAKGADGIAYVVEDGVAQDPKSPEFRDGFFKGGINELNKIFSKAANGPIENTITEVTGSGWSGKKVALTRNGTTVATVLIAYSNNKDLAYSLIVTAPDTSEQTKTFLESFKVDPDVASKAHTGENPYGVLGHAAMQLALWGGLIAVGLIIIIVAVVMALRKK